ncbi:MAG TPA: hypothetical protein VK364_13505, partial [Hymenobacter sp.]|nr:hypothetical protein [Hymenobacter sp.]
CISKILTGFSEIVDPKTYWTHGIKLYFGNGSTFTIWDEDVPDRSHFIFDGHIPQGLIEVQPNSRNLI